MHFILLERLRQGRRTLQWPAGPAPDLPDRFRGRPLVDPGKCSAGCRECGEVCPTDALQFGPGPLAALDLGKCLFCGDCAAACPEGAIAFSRDFAMAVREREDLLIGSPEARLLADALDGETRRLFGRSLRLRQVSAGGCNACEADANVLQTVVFDISRFGIQFVASPRHADGLLITGPVTRNMRLALEKTYAAVPAPRLVIAMGACAISGGPYAGHPEACDGAGGVVPVDLFIPGCPPHPLTVLDGLLRLLGRL
ncbi:MAG: 4Fe-4S binding protein [Candidatus Sericytochromatia bacterium]|nr:4Fe-4S binding protein [Candidatus Tanganyikabacteria bacterium]